MRCTSCATESPADSRFCRSCGQVLGTPFEFATIATAPEGVAVVGPHVRRLISSDFVPAGGFTPGTILLDRYRIIGLLGHRRASRNLLFFVFFLSVLFRRQWLDRSSTKV